MKALIILFLLEYIVTCIRAQPIMNAVPVVEKITENDITKRGTTLYDFGANNKCSGGTGPYIFTYSYGSQNVNAVRAILDPLSDGKIMLTNTAELDYETGKQFNLWVQCNDTATNLQAVEQAAFSLVVNDENEKPVCVCTTTTITISEERLGSAGYNLGACGMTVTDPDTNDKLIWTVLDSPGKDFFSISASSGSPATLTVQTKVPIDYEDVAVYSQPCKQLLTKVADPSGLSATGTCSICITDYNDNTPVFNPTHYTVSFFGIGTTVGTTVVTVTATDADASSANQLTYSVSLTSQFPYFDFTGSTMKVANPIDVSWGTQMEVVVLAIDSGTPQKTGTATVTVLSPTTTTTTTTVAPPSGYNFWKKKDNVIAFVCLMIVMGLIVGALLYGCYRYCTKGSCLPDCCNPEAKNAENQTWGQKQNNRPYDDDKYDYGRTPTPRPGTTSIQQIGYH